MYIPKFGEELYLDKLIFSAQKKALPTLIHMIVK